MSDLVRGPRGQAACSVPELVHLTRRRSRERLQLGFSAIHGGFGGVTDVRGVDVRVVDDVVNFSAEIPDASDNCAEAWGEGISI